jgi:hypothetical protein
VTLAEKRLARVIMGVVHQALRDARASSLIVLEPLGPEGTLFLRWCEEAGMAAVPVTSVSGATASEVAENADRRALTELVRAAGRIAAATRGSLLVHPVNRTALLLGDVPPEPLLPLGDVPASVVHTCAGGWSGSEPVTALALRAGGVDVLDRAIYRWLERREPFAMATSELAPEVSCALWSRFEAGRFSRRRAGLVPKLGYRTVGHDLRI